MKKLFLYFQNIYSEVFLGSFLLLILLNPVFKKYDYGAELPFLILFGASLFFLFWKTRKDGFEKAYLEKAMIGLFLLFYLISFALSKAKNIGFPEVLAFVSVFIFYLIFAYKKIEWKKYILNVITIGTILAVFIGFMLYFFKEETRMFGPFFNIWYRSHEWPNAFALYLLLAWPVVFLVLKEKFNFIKSLGLSLLFAALLLTYSRGAMIAFCGQIFLLLIYYFKNINLKTAKNFAIVFAIGILMFLASNYVRGFSHQVINVQDKIEFNNAESLTSETERIDFWKGAIELIKKEPLFGFGPYSFRYAYNGIQKTFLGSSDHPHNVFLKIGAENGLFALGFFVAFLLIFFITVSKRFFKLEKEARAFVYLLGVAVLGAFAHNLIDYNLNFFVNIFLLFLFLAMMRSSVCKYDNEKKSKPYCLWILTIFITAISFIQGGILVLGYTANQSYLEYFLYPRLYYVTNAQTEIENKDFYKALDFINKEISLNPLDGQAFYIRGNIYCNEKFANTDKEKCRDDYKKSLELDPMNDLKYYREYLRVLISLGEDKNEKEFIEKTKKLVQTYFYYVDYNVHFTGYTDNVEANADLVDMLIPYLNKDEKKDFLMKKDKMIKKAEALRAERE